jgi:hypothetical protein
MLSVVSPLRAVQAQSTSRTVGLRLNTTYLKKKSMYPPHNKRPIYGKPLYLVAYFGFLGSARTNRIGPIIYVFPWADYKYSHPEHLPTKTLYSMPV